jgi:RNA polymerase sigma-70 factor (ECF subfamily)
MSGESFPLAFPFGHLTPGGDEITSLYGELRQPLLRYLVCLGLSGDDAQDIVQDVFLSLQQHLAARRDNRNIRGWVFRVARNRARNRRRSYEWRFAVPLDGEAASVAHEATPERAAIAHESFRHLERAIRELSRSERECLFLRAEGLRYREIGDVLDLPTSTVADTVARAVKKLAESCHV